MKNQYHNYSVALLKSKVCFVANCIEETDPRRDKHTFIIAQGCVCCGKTEENDYHYSVAGDTGRRIKLL